MIEHQQTPEEALRELQADLDEKLRLDAPRLGTYPSRVKKNAMWVWVGAAVFSPVGHYVNGDGDVVGSLGFGAWAGGVACLIVAFGYERLFWRKVEKARALILERELEAAW